MSCWLHTALGTIHHAGGIVDRRLLITQCRVPHINRWAPPPYRRALVAIELQFVRRCSICWALVLLPCSILVVLAIALCLLNVLKCCWITCFYVLSHRVLSSWRKLHDSYMFESMFMSLFVFYKSLNAFIFAWVIWHECPIVVFMSLFPMFACIWKNA